MTNPLVRSALVVLALASPASAGPRDPLYQWTDASGAVRYTTEIERIPEELRDAKVIVTAAPRTAPERPAASPAPAPVPAPSAPVESAPPPAASVPLDPKLAALDARIAELEQSIAADEAALGDYISDPERATKQRDAAGDVAAIADRLPKLQNELRELRKQREAAAHPAAPNAAAP